MNLLFENIHEENKVEAIKDLIEDSTPRPSFFFLVIMSVSIATCGILINNSAVIIASMLIAPLLSPIMSLALGIIMNDGKLIYRSFKVLLKSTFLGIGIAILLSLLFRNNVNENFINNFENSFLNESSIIYLLIAVIAGTTTAFARVKPDLNETLPGTAIAIAIVPPLATIGIGISYLQLNLISGALVMLLLNIAGIVLSAMIMFSLMNLYTKRTIAEKSVQEADKKLEHEKAMCKGKECEK